jgi:hypothetical protein
LRLALASAINAVLANKGQGIGKNIERRGEASPDRPHLEFIAFLGFAIMIEQIVPRFTNRIR